MECIKFFKIIVSLALLLLLQSVFAKALTPVTVELKWFHQVQFAGIYAAKEKGFYKQAGLDVNIIQRDISSNAIKDVLSGKVDFGVSDSTLIKERLSGKPLVLLAVIFQHSPLVLLSLEKNRILSPAEIKGKKVMYQKNVDDAIILAMFKEFGVYEKDFIFVPHNFKDDTLIKDEKNVEVMSAYLSNQPYLYQQKGIKINIMKPQNYGIDFYGDMIFTSEKFFKAHKKTSLAFRKATLKGWAYALKHPDEVYQWLQTKYASKKSLPALRYEMEVTKRMIVPEHVELGYISDKRLATIATLYKTRNPELQNNDIFGLYYKDYDKQPKTLMTLLYIGIIIIGVLVLVVITILFFNRRLHSKIIEHTSAIQAANEELSYSLAMLDKYVCFLDLESDGTITSCSAALCDLLKIDKTSLLDHKLLDNATFLFDSESKKIQFSSALKNNNFLAGEIRVHMRGKQFVLQFTLTSAKIVGKQIDTAIVILNDITDKKKIEKLSEIDTVTNLSNRFHLSNVLKKEISAVKRFYKPLAIIMFDLDYFKTINDSYGHNLGDDLLAQIGKVLTKHLRDIDVAGRWGGDEFMIICRHTDLEQAKIIAEKIRKKIAELCVNGHSITASFGVAQWDDGDNETSMIEKADFALYKAKNNGRNKVVKHDEGNV